MHILHVLTGIFLFSPICLAVHRVRGSYRSIFVLFLFQFLLCEKKRCLLLDKKRGTSRRRADDQIVFHPLDSTLNHTAHFSVCLLPRLCYADCAWLLFYSKQILFLVFSFVSTNFSFVKSPFISMGLAVYSQNGICLLCETTTQQKLMAITRQVSRNRNVFIYIPFPSCYLLLSSFS